MIEVIAWILCGAFIGWIFSFSETRLNKKLITDILVGVSASLAGGVLMYLFGDNAFTGSFDSQRLLVAAATALVVLSIFRFLNNV